MSKLKPIFLLFFPILLFGQENPQTVSGRLADAKVLLSQRKTEDAFSILSDIQEKKAALTKKDDITFHNLLGQCYARKQQYGKAVSNFEWALSHSVDNDTLQALFNYQLGFNKYRLSQYATATDHMLQSRDLYRKLYGNGHDRYRACLNALGFFYNVQAKYSEAEKTFQEARQINLRKTGGENIQYARIINNLADVYCNLNRYDQAGELYETSLRIKEKLKGKQSLDYAKTLFNLADFQASLGRNEKAKATIQEGIDILTAIKSTNHPTYLKFKDYQAILHDKTGDVAEAEKLYKETLNLREAAGATERDDYALNLLNIGKFYERQLKFNEALPYLEKAVPLTATIYSQNHPTYGKVLSVLASVQFARGENEAAKKNYQQAVRIIQRALGRKHIQYFHAQFDYARFLRKTGKKEEAISIYKKIDKIPRHYLKRATHFLSEKELFEKIEEYKSFSTEIYSFLWEQPENIDLSILAYNSTLYYRGFILGNLQRIRHGMLKAQQVTNARDEVISLHRQLENELNKPLEERANTDDLERRIAEKESEITRTLGSFSEEEPDFSWEDIQLALSDEEAAVEYISFSDPNAGDSTFYGALLLTPFANAPTFLNLCKETDFASVLPAEAIRKADYISRIYDFSDRGAKAVGEKKVSLVDLIWFPIRKQLPDVKRVFLVPDGLLHRISISALPTSLETVVADSIELVLLGSTRKVVPSNDRILAYSGKKSLVIGGIEYHNSSQGEILASRSNTARKIWDHLPWAEKESKEVAELLEQAAFDVSYLAGIAPNEMTVVDTLEASSEGWRVLHIATHGFFSANSTFEQKSQTNFYGRGMMNSGLVLAGANNLRNETASNAMDDGLLTAYELSRLDLSKTELVVLSACETALGDLVDEEGVYGLQRAFRLAGADKLIMSLWQVPDRETKYFMVSFYKNWLNDKSTVREAFYKTQQEFRQRFVNPYQWAGFVLLE